MNTDMMVLTWNDVMARSAVLAKHLDKLYPRSTTLSIYPVPRGGIYAALAFMNIAHQRRQKPKLYDLVHLPEQADIVIDDVIDSGETKEKFLEHGPFFALVDKPVEGIDKWVSFPWERMTNDTGPEENVRRLIEFVGDNPGREGLVETPNRVVKAYKEMFDGYQYGSKEIAKMMTTFEDVKCDEMVICRDIEFYSMCEHHMLPFYGRAHVAYIPEEKVVGLSKLARLVDAYAHRLQVQEKLTHQIAHALNEHLNPLGSACLIKAKHHCMCSRGVGKQNSEMITCSLTGAFKTDPATRAEFIELTQ